jgi:cell division transport system permease protein
MRSVVYFLKEALLNGKRNFGTTLGAIITIFLSLTIIGMFMVLSVLIDRVASSVESEVEISIFVADDASDADIQAVMAYAQSLPEVSTVTFTTKEQALENFKEQSSAEIVASLDTNPLPASIEIKLADPEQVQAVVDQVIAQDATKRILDPPDNLAESVKYGQDIVERLFQVTNALRIGSLFFVVLLVVVALIFINNTIRLAILARRKEIAIMRLVGASNGFIRGPFLMEGVLQALIGSGLGILVIHFAMQQILPMLSNAVNWLSIDFSSIPMWQIYAALLVIGVIIGVLGSALAMRRYLKV